jgi:RNA polymerase sigma factor (sigma-70 family)
MEPDDDPRDKATFDRPAHQSLASLDAESLVLLARDGNLYAEHLLYQRSVWLLEAATGRYRLDPEVFVELPGELHLVFARLVHEYDPQRGVPFGAYLRRMAAPAVWSLVRRYQRRAIREAPMGDSPENAPGSLLLPDREAPLSEPGGWENHEDQILDRLCVAAAIGRLPTHQREVLWLHACGYSFPEIAALFAQDEATVRQAHHRACRRARRMLNPNDDA